VYGADSDLSGVEFPADFSDEEIAGAALWIEQEQLVARCMNDKGFDYTFALWWQRVDGGTSPKALYAIGTPGFEAEYGSGGTSSDWTTEGCRGYAVHETGREVPD
jgi:hypothetical protein